MDLVSMKIEVVNNDYIVLTNRYTGERLEISCHAGGTAVCCHDTSAYISANPARVGAGAELGFMLKVNK